MSGLRVLPARPLWLNKKIDLEKCRELNALFKDLDLNTICHQARCPNISECFTARVATFLILGKICTRGCKFCAVSSGIPFDADLSESKRVAEAVRKLGLKHVVVTSVTRDDLADGGSSIFASAINEIRNLNHTARIEVLVPDFKGDTSSIETIIRAKPDIFAHNMETVSSLYDQVRQQADYSRSLSVLKAAKELDKNIYIKSGIMLGLGETEEQVLEVLSDLRQAGCDFLSIGQYLSPSPQHFQVKEYVLPQVFEFFKKRAKHLGFIHVQSAPYVRSSYLACRYLQNCH